jgi:hypothetical protein
MERANLREFVPTTDCNKTGFFPAAVKDFGANDRLYPESFRFRVKFNRTKKIAVVSDRNCFMTQS